MQAVEASSRPGSRLTQAREAGQVVTVTVALRLAPDTHGEDRDRFDALLALLGDDPPSAWPGVDAAGPSLRIHSGARAVYRDRTEIVLTRREYDLLLCLAEHPRRVFTRPQLLDRVWGHPHTGPRSVDVHVRRLRAKIGTDLPVVTTLHGVGYRLAAGCPVEIVHDPGRV